MTDKHAKGHAIEVPIYAWKPIVLIEAHSKIPLAVKDVKTHGGFWMRPFPRSSRE